MATTAIVNVAMDKSPSMEMEMEMEHEEMLMKEPASLLVGRLKAMTWSARGKDAALREMRAQLAAAQSREAAATAEAERLRAELMAARVAEERLAADMADVEAEASHRIMRLEAQLSSLAAQMKANGHSHSHSHSHGHGGERTRTMATVAEEEEEEDGAWQAEVMMWKERAESMMRRAQVAEAAEERLANQIADLEAEWHREAMESRRIVEESLSKAATAEAAAAARAQEASSSIRRDGMLLQNGGEFPSRESFAEASKQPFVASPAYLQAICESLLGSSLPKAVAAAGTPAKGGAPPPLNPSLLPPPPEVEKLGMRLKLWDSSTLVLQAAHT